jgi:hypothetical protein
VSVPRPAPGSKPGAFCGRRLLPGKALVEALPLLRRQLAKGVVEQPPHNMWWMADHPAKVMAAFCVVGPAGAGHAGTTRQSANIDVCYICLVVAHKGRTNTLSSRSLSNESLACFYVHRWGNISRAFLPQKCVVLACNGYCCFGGIKHSRNYSKRWLLCACCGCLLVCVQCIPHVCFSRNGVATGKSGKRGSFCRVCNNVIHTGCYALCSVDA